MLLYIKALAYSSLVVGVCLGYFMVSHNIAKDWEENKGVPYGLGIAVSVAMLVISVVAFSSALKQFE